MGLVSGVATESSGIQSKTRWFLVCQILITALKLAWIHSRSCIHPPAYATGLSAISVHVSGRRQEPVGMRRAMVVRVYDLPAPTRAIAKGARQGIGVRGDARYFADARTPLLTMLGRQPSHV